MRVAVVCSLPWPLLCLILAVQVPARCEVRVTTIDLLQAMDLQVNAAGPVQVRADAARNRVIVANTLSSTLTVIDGRTDAVTNIAIGHRMLQHLKAAALAVRESTGTVYLVADGALVVVDPDSGQVVAIETEHQMESVAVDEGSGNALLCGRETGGIGFFDAAAGTLTMLPWLDDTEPLDNLNQTPPPPIRRVVALPGGKPGRPGRFVALDGLGGRLYEIDARNGKVRRSRDLPLQIGGRWHLAGVDLDGGAVYVVTETVERKVIQAARIDVDHGRDVVVPLPEYTEGVGMILDPRRKRVYIPYDNHATLHVVDFAAGGQLREIAVPTFGNDVAVLDPAAERLYVASWAHGEVDAVDLVTERFVRRYADLGIIPHMFAMTFNAANGMLYFPVGATAVNGCFGASVTRLDPGSGVATTIRTGLAPITMAEAPSRGSVLVLGNEDRMVETRADGTFEVHTLDQRFPTRAMAGPDGLIYVAYGPHQSYWPVVYIWGARNGIVTIDPADLSTYDRRIPRQPLDLALDGDGVLYLAQNNWGRETAFISVLDDAVRYLDINRRIELGDEVERETTQRLLRFDAHSGLLVAARTGEADGDPGVLLEIDPVARQVVRRTEIGPNPTDLLVEPDRIWITSFDTDAVSVVDRASGEVSSVPTGRAPLRLCRFGDLIVALDHLGGTLSVVSGAPRQLELPFEGTADGLLVWGDRLVVTGFAGGSLVVWSIDPLSGVAEPLLQHEGLYGDTTMDGHNAAFYMSGQYGDAVFTLTPMLVDGRGRLWLADFLGGKVFVIEAP